MTFDADVSETAQHHDGEQTRKTWVKPEILLATPLTDAEGLGNRTGDGVTNLS